MDDIRKPRLLAFADWAAANIRGDEKGEAQIFLDRLFQAFGQPGCLEVGGHPEVRIRKDKEDGGGTAFADYVWKPVVLIEMKRRGADLARHYRQAFDYWTRLVPGRPQYVVLCNFDEFWVYDFNAQMDSPVDRVPLVELPERSGPFSFLFRVPQTPVFGNDHLAVTRKAADHLAICFNKLISRRVERPLAQRFILQMLVALFAEDIALLDQYTVTRLLDDCKQPSDSYDLLGGLFVAMNTPGGTAGGRFKGVDYFNGGLFAEPARVELYPDEIAQLRSAADANWSKVRPEIFGTLFEHSLGQEERHAFGAHFTSAVDIMKIIGPTIVAPWRERIENARKVGELNGLLERMHSLTVLDPACGSGNFLYLAYRELKRLEARLFERLAELSRREDAGQGRFGFVTARQFFGMDINPFAVELAKVTMMIARKLAIDELHVHEHALPLDNLDVNFTACDALINAAGQPTQWPRADVIIGNPPFLGSRYLAKEHGYEYARKIHAAHPTVPRMADYCVYWLRCAHDYLPVCTPADPFAGRAGLVGTQNIRNNQSRVGGLDHIVKTGTIVEAVDNQPWSGEANVHVSIVNWVKTSSMECGGRASEASGDAALASMDCGGSDAALAGVGISPSAPDAAKEAKAASRPPHSKMNPADLLIPASKKLWSKVQPVQGVKRPRRRGDALASKECELAVRECDTISSSLSDVVESHEAIVLSCNCEPKKCYVGQYPFNEGFLLTPAEAKKWIQEDARYREVLFPYMIGRDLVEDAQPSRWIIDFGQRDLIDASSYAKPFARVQELVMPTVLRKAEAEKLATGKESTRWTRLAQRWWQFRDYQPGTMRAISGIGRYIVCSRVTKRPVFAFTSDTVHPDNALMVFPLADDYSFGIVQSNAHWQWFVTRCSKLTERFRYTPESVFDTFPWPQSPSAAQVCAVASAGRQIRRIRDEALAKIKGGLRALYRTLELPGANPLKDAHAALNAAVLDAYGFTPKQDILAALLELNGQVAARIAAGQQVTAPGVPSGFPDPLTLITDDCIRPE